MIVHDVIQRSPAWHALRLGRVCASDAADLLSQIKSGESAARRDLRLRLAVERITQTVQEDGYVNGAMQRGLDMEATARTAFEARTGQLVSTVGFVAHDDLLCGCSPDGEVGGFQTLVEIKAPKSSTHLGYLRSGLVPSAYIPQLTHQLWITGAEAVDFFSWDDRFPANLQTFLVRVHRADLDLKGYEAKVLAFLAEVDREVEAVATMSDIGAVLQEAVARA